MFYDDPFLEFVHQHALKIGKYFIIDSGEGRGYEDPSTGWDIEDLSGWLIEPTDHQKFISARKAGTADEEFGNVYVFVIWLKDADGNLKIEFRRF